jgi:hypothetical protein
MLLVQNNWWYSFTILKANGTVDSNVYLTGVTKAMVGLTNVDNISDANKPVSSAQLMH